MKDFVCPKCGSTYFGTNTLLCDGKKKRFGACHGRLKDGQSCQFQWDRSDDEIVFVDVKPVDYGQEEKS